MSQFPTLAGQVVALGGNRLTLRSPSTTRQLPLAAKSIMVNILGELVKETAVSVESSVAVWVVNDEIEKIQQLPPLAASPAILTELAQPPATGETVLLGPVPLISRAGWGATSPNLISGGEAGLYDPVTNRTGWLVYPEPLSDWLATVVVHHSALELYHGPREIQQLHILQNNFADIGYHFLIDGFGQVYEGRPLNIRGAHTGGFNTGSVGICLLGNFELMPPLTAQLDSLKELVLYLRDTYSITHLAGHGNFQPGQTVCPGQRMRTLLPAFSQEWGLIFGTGGYRPVVQ